MQARLHLTFTRLTLVCNRASRVTCSVMQRGWLRLGKQVADATYKVRPSHHSADDAESLRRSGRAAHRRWPKAYLQRTILEHGTRGLAISQGEWQDQLAPKIADLDK